MITIDNYEAFAIDYIEGELSLVEMAQMEALLAQHPALRAEFAALTENWSSLALEPDEAVVFSDTTKLLKPLAAEKTPIIVPLAAATRSLTAKYLRIAAVSVGMLFGIGALYQFLPNNTTTNFAQNTQTVSENKEMENNVNLNAKEGFGKNAENEAQKASPKMAEIPVATKNNLIKNNATLAQTNTGKNVIPKSLSTPKNNGNTIIENKNILPQKNETAPLQNTINNSISTNNAIADNTQNTQITTPQRNAIAIIDGLPTVRLQDFYFETTEDYAKTTLLGNNERVFLAQNTKNTRKSRPVLNALLPEATTEIKTDGSFWKAFLPEGTKENTTNLASITDAFRPSL